MLCSTSVTEHIFRGILAAGAIGVIAYAWPNLWITIIYLPIAVLLMRGCPTCWLLGLVETTWNKFKKPKVRVSE